MISRPPKKDPPGLRMIVTGDRIDQARLARSIGSDDADQLTGVDGKVYARECAHPAEGKRDVLHLQLSRTIP